MILHRLSCNKDITDKVLCLFPLVAVGFLDNGGCMVYLKEMARIIFLLRLFFKGGPFPAFFLHFSLFYYTIGR